jgi:hypothetical protein
MARLISVATGGSFGTASTWAISDPTALLDSEARNDPFTTLYSDTRTQPFTPGAITFDGIAIKLELVNATPTGTVRVHMNKNSDHSEVAGTEVILNVADLPTIATAGTTNEGGWVLFKLASPVTLSAATAYELEGKCSSTLQVAVYSDATTDNFSRQLRTTDVTHTPTTGDTFDIMGEHTGAGTGNNITVVMDNTATTDFGAGTDSVVAMTINKRGSLTYAYSASTNYYLKLSGDLIVYNGGTLTIGDTTNPIPRTGTAVLEFDPVADGGMGLIARNGSIVTIQGLSRTVGKNIVACKLNTDEAANSTSLGVDTNTGWLDNDVIVAAQTNRSSTNQVEIGAMNGDAAAAVLTVDGFTGTGGGIKYAKSGTTPTQGHMGLLTRNVMFRSATSTLMTYMNVKATATVDIDWCDFRYIGENATGKKGIEVETTTGSFNMQYCSIRDTEDQMFVTTGSTTNNITVSNNIWYNNNTVKTASLYPFVIAATSGTNWVVTYNYFFGCSCDSTSRSTVQLNDVGGNFSYNIFTGSISANSISINENLTIGTFSYNEVYCENSGYGIRVDQYCSGIIANCKSWFNGQSGFLAGASNGVNVNDLLVFGNTTQNLYLGTSGLINFNRLLSYSYSGTVTTNGIGIVGQSFPLCKFTDCQFSQASGNYIAHTNDIKTSNTTGGKWVFDNCLFGAGTLVTGYQTYFTSDCIMAFHKYNQTANKHYWYTKYGIAQSTGASLTDTNVRTAGSLGVRIAPEDATTGFTWEFNILAKASSIVSFMGYFQKNAAFSTDVAKVELWLPGSTVADATFTLANSTAWQACVLSANYTGTVDLLATIKVYAISATAGAYLYADDFYNAGLTNNKIAGLDTWDKGMPVNFIVDTTFDPLSVWSAATSTQTVAGTMGEKLTSLKNASLIIDGEVII